MNSPQQRLNQCLQYLAVLLCIILATALTACTAETSKSIHANEIAPAASSTPALPCTNCATKMEDPAHPNKQETVAEEGDIQQWNEGCKCYQTYHYHDDARQVCCYWANRGPSGYAWEGLDGQERYLSKEQADKPAPTCKDTMTLTPKGSAKPNSDTTAEDAFRGTMGAEITHDILKGYWTSTDPNWPL